MSNWGRVLRGLTTLEKYRLLGRMFTRPVFTSMASTGDWKQGLSFLLDAGALRRGPSRKLRDVFESAWGILRASYRNEYVYKTEIANRIVFGRHSPRTTTLQIEFPVGRSIADVAVFNGTSTAYEVKTEFDSARRIATQTADYLKVFDRIFVVSHPSIAGEYKNVIDSHVGLLAMERCGSLRLIRDATPNRERISVPTTFRCLRRKEYVSIAEQISGGSIDAPNGSIGTICENHFNSLAPGEAHDFFVRAMRLRRTDKNTVAFISELPQSLRALGYATPLSQRQREKALAVLCTEVELKIA